MNDEPEEIDVIQSFVAGQVIFDPAKRNAAPFLVLETADDGKNGLLAPLVNEFSAFKPDTYRPRWATIEQVAKWQEHYVPGARLLTAYERGTMRRLWEAYVPSFTSGQNVMREVNFNEKRSIDLAITPSHVDEQEPLDVEGFFEPDHARDSASDMEVEYYADIEGSATSSDGRVFVLKAHTLTGEPVNVAFPHSETSSIVEHIAVQSGNAKDNEGRKINAAFRTSSFALGVDPSGNAILGMQVGSTGTINFLLKDRMAEELMDLLGKYVCQRTSAGPKH